MVQRIWEKDEIELLVSLFKSIKLPSMKLQSKSKTDIIREELKKHNYLRTNKSIRRKLFRLDLTDFKVNNEKIIESRCFDCDCKILIRQRYFDKYNKENFRCEKCIELKRRSWSMTDKGKEYHKKYLQRYRKNEI